MYRKITQAKLAIINRLNDLDEVRDDKVLNTMIGGLLTNQITYYQRLLTSISGTILRKLRLIQTDDEHLMTLIRKNHSVHTK